MRKIKAAVSDGNGSFKIESIELGLPANDEVVVEIKAAGICHTDIDSTSWGEPLVLGHEGAGVISAVGKHITKVKVGDAVMLNWAIPCGSCYQCSHGEQHICDVSSPATGDGISGHSTDKSTLYQGKPIKRAFHLGTMSEAVIVKEAAVVKIRDSKMPFNSAAIVGCGVMTGYGSVVNAAKVKAGSTVVVVGCGGVGLNVIQAANVAGARKIIAIDVLESKLAKAVEFGATDTIVALKEDPGFLHTKEKVLKLVKKGADYAFECTALAALAPAPLAMIRNGGTAVQVSGYVGKVAFDGELFQWDKIYINPLYGKCRPETDFPIIESLYASGKLKLDEQITHTYTLEDLQKGFDDLLSGKVNKAVVAFT